MSGQLSTANQSEVHVQGDIQCSNLLMGIFLGEKMIQFL